MTAMAVPAELLEPDEPGSTGVVSRLEEEEEEEEE